MQAGKSARAVRREVDASVCVIEAQRKEAEQIGPDDAVAVVVVGLCRGDVVAGEVAEIDWPKTKCLIVQISASKLPPTPKSCVSPARAPRSASGLRREK
jgi:hypothetical protein